MSLRINNNIASINGHRNMVKNDMAVSKSLEKLSSGLRINRAADDAAGLIISEQMRAQIAGLDQATANSEQAVSMVQTAEGALDEMNSVLKKARQLAIHAANAGVNDTTQLTADQTELDNITSSITRIATNTQFGTKKILDGTLSSSKILNSTVATQFKQTGLSVGNIDINITTAGVKGSSAATAITNNTVAAALTNSSTAAGVTGLSTFDNQTTLSIIGADQTSMSSITVAAGTSVTDALAALNTKGIGITASIGAVGAFQLSADDVGTYANGAHLRIQGQGLNSSDDIGFSIYDTTTTTPVTTGAISGGKNVEVNRSTDGVAAASVSGIVTTNPANFFKTSGAGTAQAAQSGVAASTFTGNTTLSLVDAGGKVLAQVDALADPSTPGAADGTENTLGGALTALNAAAAGKFAIGLVGSNFTITAQHSDAASNGVYLKMTSGATSVVTTATTGGVDNTSTGFGAVALTVNGNRGSSLSGASSTGAQTVSLTLATTTAGSYANALSVSTGAVFQIGANRDQTAAVAIDSAKATDLGIGAKNASGVALTNYTSLQDLTSSKFLTNGRAQDAISAIDKAIDDVTNQRGQLGAVQADTLDTTLNSLRVTHENLTAAESTIRDVDYAHESATFTRNNILIQASTAMLAQANQLPQSVLKLLG